MVADFLNTDQQFIRKNYDIVVVGTGPVGVRFIQELIKLNIHQSIAIFGDEPWHPYNRVKLSSLISGDVKEEALYSSFDLTKYHNVTTFYNNRILEIDRYTKEVIDSNGERFSYGKLVLATGSRPHIPMIEGLHLQNVFTFRDLNDARSLMGRSVRTRTTVVIGGGLLGLEAARAMQRFNTQVHVIEHSMWLMFNQIDEQAGQLLKDHIKSLGISVHTSERVKKISGDEKVTAVEFGNGKTIECDTVIIAAGIVSNTILAMDAGLRTANGIRINDHLQTSDKDVYAIGECVEHRNTVYGLVAPGLEQAAVLAHHIQGENCQYTGSMSATNLKVLDYPVFSMGDTGISARSNELYVYQDKDNKIYRKIVVINGRLRGAMGIGTWPGVHRFQEAVLKQRRIWPWQTSRFVVDGVLWNDAQSENVIDWPATATICNCTGVTRGQLDHAIKLGASTVDELAIATGVSTVCGSCKNIVSDYIGGNASPEPIKAYRSIITSSVVAIIAILILFFLPAMSYDSSVEGGLNFDKFWRDGGYKQLTGFSILALSALLSVLSFRKRIKKIYDLWDFSSWRLMHVIVGVITIGVLLIHTGFRMGDNLNFALMMIFSGLLFVGSLAGVAIGYEHNMPRRLSKQIRIYAVWSHIILLWPLPALLGFHILKTYYF